MRIGTLEKTFRIIDILGEHPQGLRLSEMGRILGLPDSSVHHILSSLRSEFYVDQDQDTKRYYLGFKFLSISSKILQNLDIRRIAFPHLRQLHQRVNETVNLTILHNGQVTFIDKIQRLGGLSLDTYLGFRTDPHAAASGKVLLAGLSRREVEDIYQNRPLKSYGQNTITSLSKLMAELKQVKDHGYAVDDEEYYVGIRCVAAPIKSRSQTVAAVSVTGSITTMTMKRIKHEIIEQVRDTAQRISREMPE
ncbi:MAG: IclR family transcriptional regulator [Desulfarculaceae bacterium]|jgi:DNA-binding IclR family transcriptional regulator